MSESPTHHQSQHVHTAFELLPEGRACPLTPDHKDVFVTKARQALVNTGHSARLGTIEAECVHNGGSLPATPFPGASSEPLLVLGCGHQGALEATHLGLSHEPGARERWAPPRLHPFLFMASGHSFCFLGGRSPHPQMGTEFRS